MAAQSLAEVREHIDRIDQQLVALIAERGRWVQQAARFKSDADEIHFFRAIKPQILGKLIYYNKIYRIETTCPVSNGKMYYSYFSAQLANLKTGVY